MYAHTSAHTQSQQKAKPLLTKNKKKRARAFRKKLEKTELRFKETHGASVPRFVEASVRQLFVMVGLNECYGHFVALL